MEEIRLNGLNEIIYKHETKEGLPVYMWVQEKVNSTYMTLSVKYGSIHTKFKIGKKIYNVPDGIAHFLEHLKFNMDESKTAHDEFYRLGGDANAFTTFNYTSYIVFATEKKKENLKLLLDFVYNPYFNKKLVNKEKGIIIEEANMGEDDPYMVTFFDSLKAVLKKSNYRKLITGTEEDINKTTLEDIKLVYDTFYHPKNMFLCITGNFNPYEMAKVVDDTLMEKEFGDYVNPEIIDCHEPKNVNSKFYKKELNISYPEVKYLIKLPINKIKSNNTLVGLKDLANLLLNVNFGSTSTFQEELKEKELITSLNFACDYYDNYLVMKIRAKTKYADEVIKRIEDKLNNLSINEEDFKRKKNACIATLILDYEDIEGVNMKIQDEIINYGEIISDYKKMLEDQTMDDLEELIANIDFENVSICVFEPPKNQDS